METDEPGVSYRPASVADAGTVAALHAASWRRFYRGAYADSFLDGDVLADRRKVWAARLAAQRTAREPDSVTILAEAGADRAAAGFVHLVLDDDDQWGSLVDNLHVTPARHRHGIGSALMIRAARAVLEHGATRAMYLWVLEQNSTAQAFYAAHGGQEAERAFVGVPGGVPGRLNGRPVKLRYVWPDVSALAQR